MSSQDLTIKEFLRKVFKLILFICMAFLVIILILGSLTSIIFDAPDFLDKVVDGIDKKTGISNREGPHADGNSASPTEGNVQETTSAQQSTPIQTMQAVPDLQSVASSGVAPKMNYKISNPQPGSENPPADGGTGVPPATPIAGKGGDYYEIIPLPYDPVPISPGGETFPNDNSNVPIPTPEPSPDIGWRNIPPGVPITPIPYVNPISHGPASQ